LSVSRAGAAARAATAATAASAAAAGAAPRRRRQQDDQRHGCEPGAAAAPGPEGQHRRQRREHGAAEGDDEAEVRVEAAVGNARARQGAESTPDHGGDRAPAGRPQPFVGDASRQQGERQGEHGDGSRGDPARDAAKAPGGHERQRGQEGHAGRLPRPEALGGLDHLHPVQAAEDAQRDQRRPAGGQRVQQRAVGRHRIRVPRGPAGSRPRER
jgi:hypothetical protein